MIGHIAAVSATPIDSPQTLFRLMTTGKTDL